MEQERISAEGHTLEDALKEASDRLQVDPSLLDFDYDLEHFRTESGRNRPVETVKISAWKASEESLAKKKADAAKRRESDKRSSSNRGEPERREEYVPAEGESMEGAESAKAWLQTLSQLLEIEATVDYKLRAANTAEMQMTSEQGGRLVGRRGSSLQSILLLFRAAMEKDHPDWSYTIEVNGGQPRERGGRSSERRPSERRSARGKLGQKDIKDLENLAQKLTRKVIKANRALVIRQNFNSFERRVIHMAVKEIEGVVTESFVDDGVKRIRILPESSETGEE